MENTPFKTACRFLPFDLEEIWNQFSKYLFLKDSESGWAFQDFQNFQNNSHPRAHPFPPGLASDKWHHETSADVIWACKTALYLKLLCFLFLLCGGTHYIHAFYISKNQFNVFAVTVVLENGKKVGYIWHFLLNFFTK